MNREQLSADLLAAVSRHWRSSIDRSGPTPAMAADLTRIAVEYAQQHAERVIARRELREEAAMPLAAEFTGGGGGIDAPGPFTGGGGASAEHPGPTVHTGGPGSARTRTRTRGGPK